jgi:hypothetical protein
MTAAVGEGTYNTRMKEVVRDGRIEGGGGWIVGLTGGAAMAVAAATNLVVAVVLQRWTRGRGMALETGVAAATVTL